MAQNVLWLEIPIDDPMGVQMLHHKEDLPHQKARILNSEGSDLGDGVEEVFSFD